MDNSENTQGKLQKTPLLEKLPKSVLLNNLPTSTVTQARVNLFAPTSFTNNTHLLKDGDHVVLTKKVTENAWGKCEIIGTKLTQAHKSALESIIACYTGLYKHENGDITLLVRLPEVLNMMGKKNHHSVFYGLLKDMSLTLVSIVTKKVTIVGHIVQGYRWSNIPDPKVRDSNKNVREGWDATHFAITLGAAFIAIYEQDLNISYPDLVPAINKLRYGETMSVVRFLLTQSKGSTDYNTDCDKLLTYIGAIDDNTSRQTKSKLRIKLQSEAETLAQFGITFDGYKIRFAKPKGVYFQSV